jgi:hypothetical protein
MFTLARNSIQLVLLLAFIGCATSGPKYRKVTLDYPAAEDQKAFEDVKFNILSRGEAKEKELLILQKAGPRYLAKLSQDINSWLENLEEAAVSAASRKKATAKNVDDFLVKYLPDYKSTKSFIESNYSNLLAKLKTAAVANIEKLNSSSDYDSAVNLAKDYYNRQLVDLSILVNTTDKYMLSMFDAEVSNDTEFDKFLSFIKDNKSNISDTVRSTLGAKVVPYLLSYSASNEEQVFELLDKIKSVDSVISLDPDLEDLRTKLINNWSYKLFVMKSMNTAGTSLKALDGKLLQALSSSISLNNDYRTLVGDGKNFESNLNDNFANNIGEFYEKVVNKDIKSPRTFLVLVEINNVNITKSNPETYEERVEKWSGAGGFAEGLRMGAGYVGEISHFEYTVRKQEAQALAFIRYSIYDHSKHSVVESDSFEVERSYSSTEKSKIMAVGQDQGKSGYNYFGTGPMKKIPASYVPQHVQSSFSRGITGPLPNNDKIKNDLIEAIVTRLNKEVQNSIRH